MINLLGEDAFAERLADVLERQLGHPNFHIFLYKKKNAPAALANRPEPISYDRGLHNYLTYTYVINPAYRAFQVGQASGVYLISDFIQSDNRTIINQHGVDVHIETSEVIGYRTPGWPKNKAEVIVLINLPNGTALDFSFLTPLGSPQTRACQDSLTRLFPILEAAILRQFALNPRSLDVADVATGVEDRFQNFGRETLTAREREIVQLILIGHSSNSICLKLGVSLPTVKTHRRNIYSKLQISSQAELFNLFLKHLK
jgi:DNA-binding CsgD family transcriptional regulator